MLSPLWGHSTRPPGRNAHVYVQAVPESVRDTVEKMDWALRKMAKAAKEKGLTACYPLPPQV